MCCISEDLALIPLNAGPWELNYKDTRTLSWQQFNLPGAQALPLDRLQGLLDVPPAWDRPAACVPPALPAVPRAPRPFAKLAKASSGCWEQPLWAARSFWGVVKLGVLGVLHPCRLQGLIPDQAAKSFWK